LGQFVQFGNVDVLLTWRLLFLALNCKALFHFIQKPLLICDIDERTAIYIHFLLLGQFQLHPSQISLSLTLSYIKQFRPNRPLTLRIHRYSQGHARHEMTQDVSIVTGIVLFYFPEALIEGQLVSPLGFHLFQNDLLALCREHAATRSQKKYFSVCWK